MDEFYDSGFRLLFYKGIVCRKGFRHFVLTFCNYFWSRNSLPCSAIESKGLKLGSSFLTPDYHCTLSSSV